MHTRHVDEVSFKRAWNHRRRVCIRIMPVATGDRMARSQSKNEQGFVENVEHVQGRRRLFTAYEAWFGRLRHYVSQRDHAAGFWMMSRDGHLVRQSWQPAAERADLDCAPCCM